MQVAYTLSGGAPVVKRYQAGTTISTRGIPIIGSLADATTDIGFVEPCPQATALGVVGLGLDTTGTVAATGVTDTDTLLISVVINPDAVYRAKLSGGTASDTALNIQTASAASTDGSIANNCTTFDNGICWGYEGANAGEQRVTDDAAGSFAIAMPNAIAANDTFLAAGVHPCATAAASSAFMTLTAALDQVQGEVDDDNNDNFICVDNELRDIAGDGTTNSFYHIIANAHAFASSSLT